MTLHADCSLSSSFCCRATPADSMCLRWGAPVRLHTWSMDTQPRLQIYIGAEQRWGVPTKVLLLECLDVAGIAEELGAADAEAALEDQLRAVRRHAQQPDLKHLHQYNFSASPKTV